MDKYGEGNFDYGGYNQPGGNESFGQGYAAKTIGTKPVRPIVDPSETGEVDPEKYGPAKDATHKIRGKSDVLEFLFGAVDQELLMVKTFYFFFYSAFGSLFPLMGVYFKQMGMNAGHCGLLIGSRPFVEFLSAPFWGSYADRWQKGKTLLLTSLACWIIFTLPIGFIQPPATSCMERKNDEYTLKTPEIPRPGFLKRELHLDSYDFSYRPLEKSEFFHFVRKRSVRPYANRSPVEVGLLISNYNEKEHKDLVLPSFSSIVYRTQDIQKAFFLLLLLVIIGEFFSAPAITLADSAVITLLGEDADRYGHQRMFGSLGWGLAMFFVGIALDHSTSFPDHPCGPTPMEKNYTICFATFSVLMGAALITATQINFKYDSSQETTIEKPPIQPTQEDTLQNQLGQQLGLPNLTNPSINVEAQPVPNIGQTKMFAQTTREMPEWVTVLKQFKNLKCASFLFVAWFMGFGIGLIFTFLFWHLQDYGGSPTLFGVASVINHISEIFAYFFSFRLITQMGHVKVLCLGLVGNVIRFLYISWLTNPWWVLPFEFMQGITHAAVWAACCSYIAHNTPQHLRSSAQGVLQGIHHGLGRGCGAVIGGILVNYCGSTNTFRGYGFACAVVLGVFVFINFYHKDVGFLSDLPPTEDPHQVAEETSHLAPHGVPSNPIPRALSSTRLHDLANADQNSYGSTYQTVDGSLGIPGQAGGKLTKKIMPLKSKKAGNSDKVTVTYSGAVNPFRQNGAGGGYSFRMAEIAEETSQYSPENDYAYNLNEKIYKFKSGNGNFECYRYKCRSEDEQIRRHFKLYNDVLSATERQKLVAETPVRTTVRSN